MTSRVGAAEARPGRLVPALRRSAAGDQGSLESTAEVAPGIAVSWDPAAPRRCVADRATQARIAALDRAPWLRLAAVSVLDRLLYLPVDQSLLDAETACAQLALAHTLPTREPIRELLISRALDGARRAAPAVVACLDGFANDDRCLPVALVVALEKFVQHHVALAREVQGFDAALAAVSESWDRLVAIERVRRGPRQVGPPLTVRPSRPGTTAIDPRTVPARVLQLGPNADTAEINVDAVHRGGGPVIRVRVDAFSTAWSPDDVDIGVRLVDRHSGEVDGYGMLGRPLERHPSATDSTRTFESILALPPSTTLADVDVELFTVAGSISQVRTDRAELRRVRRATLFLADWRALVADVRLWGQRVAPASRIRTIVRRFDLEHVAGPKEPLWRGGPSRFHLACLAELGDRTLSGRIRGWSRAAAIPGDDGGAAAVLAAVSGPGELLTAELVASHERPRTA